MTIVAHAHPFVIGVDTHARNHALAVLAATGEVIDTAQFPTSSGGDGPRDLVGRPPHRWRSVRPLGDRGSCLLRCRTGRGLRTGRVSPVEWWGFGAGVLADEGVAVR